MVFRLSLGISDGFVSVVRGIRLVVASGAGEWCSSGMHIDNHLNVVRDGRAAPRIDRCGDDDVAGEISFNLVLALTRAEAACCASASGPGILNRSHRPIEYS
jgi:hypothetical protein